MSKSHAEFYIEHNISPVSQDISNLQLHFQRRESLYRSLGIVPTFISGRSVLEFGPGSGHNALYTASLLPHTYDLVDANPKGVEETRERLRGFGNKNITVTQSLFENFQTDRQFDLVWAEGCIPLQDDPLTLLKHVASFVNPGGVLCVSINNGVSYLSETIRRLFRDRYFSTDKDISEQLEDIKPYISDHLSNLKGMSRPVDDWLLDSIIQPLKDRKLLSIPDVIGSIGHCFEAYNTSPKFLVDWRWYKEVIGTSRLFNEIALERYYQSNLNLLDYRFEFEDHSVAFGEKLEILGNEVWVLMCRIENGEKTAWTDVFHVLAELASLVRPRAEITSDTILEAVELLNSGDRGRATRLVPSWWGRGQQYLTLIRNS
jgi:SAM-dependent methyltransferase